MTNTKKQSLDGFGNKSSRRLFHILGMPDNFLEIKRETWSRSEDLKIAHDAICSITTTNDYPERRVALIQKMT